MFDTSSALNPTIQYQIDANWLADGWRAYMAKAVQDKFHKPCVAIGNIRNPQVAEDIIANGTADLIGLGRGLIADPDWCNKAKYGDVNTIRKCISCNIGCVGNRIGGNRPLRCTVNPDIINGDEYKKNPVKKPCNVVVIGAGTAGLEAACTAAEVGCNVTLIEKKDVLGGLATEISKIPDKNIVTMEKSQVQRILAAVNDTAGMSEGEILRHGKIIKRDYAIMMLFFGTGIRVSELVGIDLSDIDFYNASLLITRKGGDEDEVYFGPEVQRALEDYVSAEREILLAGKEDPALFISMQHRRMTVRSVQLMIKGYAEKAGLNMKVTPHALRRTFASQVYASSNDIYLVAEALHHSSVETTRKHYAKMSKERKRDAASAVSELFEDD